MQTPHKITIGCNLISAFLKIWVGSIKSYLQPAILVDESLNLPYELSPLFCFTNWWKKDDKKKEKGQYILVRIVIHHLGMLKESAQKCHENVQPFLSKRKIADLTYQMLCYDLTNIKSLFFKKDLMIICSIHWPILPFVFFYTPNYERARRISLCLFSEIS